MLRSFDQVTLTHRNNTTYVQNRFNEQFVALQETYIRVHGLGVLVLTMFLALAYKRYDSFYWNTRKVQVRNGRPI